MQEYFLATTGSDSTGDGTINSPWKTLEKARDTIRLLSPLPDGGVTVYLRGGFYERTSSFTLTSADSGTSTQPIVYKAYQDEVVRLVGGKQVLPANFSVVTSGDALWAKVPTAARGNVQKTSLASLGSWPTIFGVWHKRGRFDWESEAEDAVMEFTVDDEPQILAQYPNKTSKALLSTGYVSTTAWTYAANATVDGCAGESDLRCFGPNGSNKYHGDDIGVSSINATTHTITLSSAPKYSGGHVGFAIRNSLKLLDQAGEYWINRANGDLYYWPKAGFSSATLAVSTLETYLLTMTSVGYVKFENLIWGTTRRTQVSMTGCTHITFYKCNFDGAGKTAMKWGATNTSILVDRCNVRWMGESGMVIDCATSYKTSLTSTNCTIRNTLFDESNRFIRFSFECLNIDSVGILVTHCEFKNLPTGPGIRVWAQKNIIEYSYFHDCFDEGTDMAMYYIGRSWALQGNVVRYNIFKNFATKDWWISHTGGTTDMCFAVYVDDAASGIDCHHNVFIDTDTAYFQRGGPMNKCYNNLIYNCYAAFMADRCGNDYFSQNGENRSVDVLGIDPDYENCSPSLTALLGAQGWKTGIWASTYPDLATVPNTYTGFGANGWDEPWLSTIERNFFFGASHGYWQRGNWIPVYSYFSTRGTTTGSGMSGNWPAWSSASADANLAQQQNPLFVDYANGDYNLQPTSPVYTRIPTWEDIPVDDIGIEPEGVIPPPPIAQGNAIPIQFGFDYAKSSTEASNPQYWDGLKGLWVPGMGVTGDEIWNLAQNSYHGVIQGTGYEWKYGRYGRALGLYQTGAGYVDVGQLHSGKLSILAVVKWDFDSSSVIVSKHGTLGQYGWHLYRSSTDVIEFKVSITGSGFAGVTTPALTTDLSKWHVILGVYDGVRPKVYVDGILYTGTTDVVGLIYNSTAPMCLGRSVIGGDLKILNGQLALVAMWDRPLDKSQAMELLADPFRMLQRVSSPYAQPQLALVEFAGASSDGTSSEVAGLERIVSLESTEGASTSPFADLDLISGNDGLVEAGSSSESGLSVTSPSGGCVLYNQPILTTYSEFATCAAEAMYPELWKGLLGVWVPALGVVSGTIPNLAQKTFPGTITGTGLTWPLTKWGPAMKFDTSPATYVNCGRPSVSGLTVFALARWDSDSSGRVCGRHAGTPEWGFHVSRLAASDSLEFKCDMTDSGFAGVTATGAIAINTWYSLFCTHAGDLERAWINGTKYEAAAHAGIVSNPNTDFMIGRTELGGDTNILDGQVVIVCLWDRGLPGDQWADEFLADPFIVLRKKPTLAIAVAPPEVDLEGTSLGTSSELGGMVNGVVEASTVVSSSSIPTPTLSANLFLSNLPDSFSAPNDFEISFGDWEKIKTSVADLAISTSAAKRGLQGVRVTSGGSQGYTYLRRAVATDQQPRDIYAGFWIRFNSPITTVSTSNIVQWTSLTGGQPALVMFGYRVTGMEKPAFGVAGINDSNTYITATPFTTIDYDTWYYVVLHLHRDATAGQAEMFIDGQLAGQTALFPNELKGVVTYLCHGGLGNFNFNGNYDIDDLVTSTTYPSPMSDLALEVAIERGLAGESVSETEVEADQPSTIRTLLTTCDLTSSTVASIYYTQAATYRLSAGWPSNSNTSDPVQTPLIMGPNSQNEPEMYNYSPTYQPGPPAISSTDKVFIRNGDYNTAVLQTLNDDGTWTSTSIQSLIDAIGFTYNGLSVTASAASSYGARIVFDQEGSAYTLINTNRGRFVMYSHDLVTWNFTYAGRGWQIEHPAGPQALAYPPSLAAYPYSYSTAALSSNVGIITITKNLDGTLTLNPPVEFTGGRGHFSNTISGGDSRWFVTTASQVFVFWSEWPLSDPLTGTHHYASVINRATGVVSDPVELGVTYGYGGAVVADAHCVPAVTVDSNGYFHVVMGAHNATMLYRKSSSPYNIASWGAAEDVTTAAWTYPSLVIDDHDTLHLVARSYGGIYYQALAYTKKEVGQAWTEKQFLVHDRYPDGHRSYNLYYQQLQVSPDGHLFLSYSHYINWLTQEEYDAYCAKWPADGALLVKGAVSGGGSNPTTSYLYTGQKFHDPAIIVSKTHGTSWNLVRVEDLQTTSPTNAYLLTSGFPTTDVVSLDAFGEGESDIEGSMTPGDFASVTSGESEVWDVVLAIEMFLFGEASSEVTSEAQLPYGKTFEGLAEASTSSLVSVFGSVLSLDGVVEASCFETVYMTRSLRISEDQANNQPESLQAMLSSEPLPQMPQGISTDLETYLRDMQQYLIRQFAKITEEAIAQTLGIESQENVNHTFKFVEVIRATSSNEAQVVVNLVLGGTSSGSGTSSTSLGYVRSLASVLEALGSSSVDLENDLQAMASTTTITSSESVNLVNNLGLGGTSTGSVTSSVLLGVVYTIDGLVECVTDIQAEQLWLAGDPYYLYSEVAAVSSTESSLTNLIHLLGLTSVESEGEVSSSTNLRGLASTISGVGSTLVTLDLAVAPITIQSNSYVLSAGFSIPKEGETQAESYYISSGFLVLASEYQRQLASEIYGVSSTSASLTNTTGFAGLSSSESTSSSYLPGEMSMATEQGGVASSVSVMSIKWTNYSTSSGTSSTSSSLSIGTNPNQNFSGDLGELGWGHSTASKIDVDGDGVDQEDGDADDLDSSVHSYASVISKYGTLESFLSHLGYNPARIFFISTSGNDSTGVISDISRPFRTWTGVSSQLRAFDMVIFREGTHTQRVFLTGKTDITILGMPGEAAVIDVNKLYDNCVKIENCRRVSVENIYGKNADSNCFSLTGYGSGEVLSDIIIRRCTAQNGFRGFGLMSNSNGRWENITFDRCLARLNDAEHGFYLGCNTQPGVGLTIKNSIAHGNTGQGFYISGRCYNTLIYGNVAHSNGTNGLRLTEGCRTTLVENNVFFCNGKTEIELYNYASTWYTDGRNYIAPYNLFYNTIQNNTCYHLQAYESTSDKFGCIRLKDDFDLLDLPSDLYIGVGKMSPNFFRNNVLYNDTTKGCFVWFENKWWNDSLFQNNLCYNPNYQRFLEIASTAYTVSQAQALNPSLILGNVWSNPLFKATGAIASCRFDLNSGSPGINLGVSTALTTKLYNAGVLSDGSLYPPTYDLRYTPRTSTPDAGAYERQ